jgi:hypothetical protein
MRAPKDLKQFLEARLAQEVGAQKGRRYRTLQRVRNYFLTHPGAMQKDVERDLRMCHRSVTLYTNWLRREWRR